MNRTCLLHCLSEYGHDAQGSVTTSIDGVGLYAGRGLVVPAQLKIVPDHPVLSAACDYMRRVGIGPKRIVHVPSMGSLYDGVRASSEAQRAIVEHVAQDGDVEFYIPGPAAWALCHELGVPQSRVRNQRPELAPETDKVGMRRLGEQLGLRTCFPSHAFSRGKEETMRVARTLFAEGHARIVIKRPDLASGEGQLVIGSINDLSQQEGVAFLHRYAVDGVELVVEAWWEGEDFSAVFEVDFDEVRLMHMSGQFMRSADGKTHMGNFLGNRPNQVFPSVGSCSWHNRMEVACRQMISVWQQRGYRGKIGFDGKVRPHAGEFVLLEVNARPSASIFARYVLEQVRRSDDEEIGVSMLSVTPPRAFSIEEMVALLGSDAYNPSTRRGVIIGNPVRMGDMRHPETPIHVVADSVSQSIETALTIKRRVEGDRFDPVTVPDFTSWQMAS